jgi:hypothetical protein
MTIGDIPKQRLEALAAIMNGYSSTDFTKIFTWHYALPMDGIYKSSNYISLNGKKNIL